MEFVIYVRILMYTHTCHVEFSAYVCESCKNPHGSKQSLSNCVCGAVWNCLDKQHFFLGFRL